MNSEYLLTGIVTVEMGIYVEHLGPWRPSKQYWKLSQAVAFSK
jgi:hypothetical protein